MMHEFVYTSARQGLAPGSKGLCVVAKTPNLPADLARDLESLSSYTSAFGPADSRATDAPTVYSHLQRSRGGQTLHVLSRVADAGLDFTSRSNLLAHHVVFGPHGLPSAGPAWLLQHNGFMRTVWDEEPKLLPADRPVPDTRIRPAVCGAWERLAGDPGWGGWLIDWAQNHQNGKLFILVQPGADVLALVAESLALLPQDQRWQYSFATSYKLLPPKVACQWQFIVDETQAAAKLRKRAGVTLLELSRPSQELADGPFVYLARHGRPRVPARVSESKPRPPRVKPVRRQSPGQSDDELEEAIRVGQMSTGSGGGDGRNSSPLRPWMWIVGGGIIAGVIVLLALLAAGLMGNGERPPVSDNGPAKIVPENQGSATDGGTAGQSNPPENGGGQAADEEALVSELQQGTDELTETNRAVQNILREVQGQLSEVSRQVDLMDRATGSTRPTSEGIANLKQEHAALDQELVQIGLTIAGQQRQLSESLAKIEHLKGRVRQHTSVSVSRQRVEDRAGIPRISAEITALSQRDLPTLRDQADVQGRRLLKLKTRLDELTKQIVEPERGVATPTTGPFSGDAGPHHVDLPPPRTPTKPDAAKAMVAKLPVSDPSQVHLSLSGEVLSEGRRFVLLEEETSQGDRVWKVAVAAKDASRQTPIGIFELADAELFFVWEYLKGRSGAEPQLRNCVLKIKAGESVAALQLRNPVVSEAGFSTDGPVALTVEQDVKAFPEIGTLVLLVKFASFPEGEPAKQSFELELTEDELASSRGRRGASAQYACEGKDTAVRVTFETRPPASSVIGTSQIALKVEFSAEVVRKVPELEDRGFTRSVIASTTEKLAKDIARKERSLDAKNDDLKRTTKDEDRREIEDEIKIINKDLAWLKERSDYLGRVRAIADHIDSRGAIQLQVFAPYGKDHSVKLLDVSAKGQTTAPR